MSRRSACSSAPRSAWTSWTTWWASRRPRWTASAGSWRAQRWDCVRARSRVCWGCSQGFGVGTTAAEDRWVCASRPAVIEGSAPGTAVEQRCTATCHACRLRTGNSRGCNCCAGRPVNMEEEFRLLQLAGDHQNHDNKPNQTSAYAIVCAGHKAAGGHGGGVPAADAAGHRRGHPRAALRRVRQGGGSCTASMRQGTASMGPALLGNIMHGVACRWCSLSRASTAEQMPKRRNGGGGHAAVAAAPPAAAAAATAAARGGDFCRGGSSSSSSSSR